MKRFLLPIFVGIGLMVLFALLAGFAGGACHCESPVGVFFPYTAIVRVAFSLELLGDVIFILQYPIYALTIAKAKGDNRKGFAFLILMAFHFAAVLVALPLFKHR